MKKGRNIEKPMLFESSHESAAERVFVRELNHGETTKIPDDHEYVLVNGIHVKQVVLHLPHDLAERWQVTAHTEYWFIRLSS